MRVIVTNDDGVDAPGVAALAELAAELGDVVTVAPVGAQSGVGHQLTTHAPIRVAPLGPARYAVGGTPADCARLALTELAPDADWLLSGINAGGNLGADVYTSGTVAATREAALLGRRAIAVSHYIGRDGVIDWLVAAQRLRPVLRLLFERPLDAGHFWSVNLPHPSDDVVPRIVFCGLDTRPLEVRYRRDGADYVYVGDYHTRPRQPGRDVDVCMRGDIAVTKVTLEIAAD
jgi:5'-nucleotidase